ncbi:MAG TPA: hypothetical protein VI389_10250 [Geobacteraceae bacterium]
MNGRVLSFFLLVCGAFLLYGCGSTDSTANKQQGVATIKVVGAATTGLTLNGVDITLDLPPGATPHIDPATSKPVVQLNGIAASAVPLFDVLYTPPANSLARSTLRIVIITATGFGADQSLTIPFDLAPGFDPAVEQFRFANYRFTDENGALLPLVPELVPTYIYAP